MSRLRKQYRRLIEKCFGIKIEQQGLSYVEVVIMLGLLVLLFSVVIPLVQDIQSKTIHLTAQLQKVQHALNRKTNTNMLRRTSSGAASYLIPNADIDAKLAEIASHGAGPTGFAGCAQLNSVDTNTWTATAVRSSSSCVGASYASFVSPGVVATARVASNATLPSTTHYVVSAYVVYESQPVGVALYANAGTDIAPIPADTSSATPSSSPSTSVSASTTPSATPSISVTPAPSVSASVSVSVTPSVSVSQTPAPSPTSTPSNTPPASVTPSPSNSPAPLTPSVSVTPSISSTPSASPSSGGSCNYVCGSTVDTSGYPLCNGTGNGCCAEFLPPSDCVPLPNLTDSCCPSDNPCGCDDLLGLPGGSNSYCISGNTCCIPGSPDTCHALEAGVTCCDNPSPSPSPSASPSAPGCQTCPIALPICTSGGTECCDVPLTMCIAVNPPTEVCCMASSTPSPSMTQTPTPSSSLGASASPSSSPGVYNCSSLPGSADPGWYTECCINTRYPVENCLCSDYCGTHGVPSGPFCVCGKLPVGEGNHNCACLII